MALLTQRCRRCIAVSVPLFFVVSIVVFRHLTRGPACGPSVCSGAEYCSIFTPGIAPGPGSGSNEPAQRNSESCQPLPLLCQILPTCRCLGLFGRWSTSCTESDDGFHVHIDGT